MHAQAYGGRTWSSARGPWPARRSRALGGEAAQIAAATDWLSLHADRPRGPWLVLRLEERMDEAVSRLEQALGLERKGNLVGAARRPRSPRDRPT